TALPGSQQSEAAHEDGESTFVGEEPSQRPVREPVEQDVRQPLVDHPGLAAGRPAKRILMRDTVRLEDHLARLRLPPEAVCGVLEDREYLRTGVAGSERMGNGRSGGWPAVPIEPTAEERAELERISRQRIAPHREVIRARALLMAAADARAIGRAVSVSDRTF